MSKIPIYSFSATTGIVGTDYFVILNGLIPKLLPKSSLDTIYATTVSPSFTGTVTVPTPTNNNSNQAATTAWVKSQLNSSNISTGTSTLDQVLNTKVQLGGVLSGTVLAPSLTNTGVVAGTYNFATIQVGADGRVISATNNTVSGGTIPTATSTNAGTVRTDINQANPIVYLKDTVDNNFISRTTNANNITAVHSFTNGVKLGATNLTISGTAPTVPAFWMEPNFYRVWETNGTFSIDTNEKTIETSFRNISGTDYSMHTVNSSSFNIGEYYNIGGYSTVFRYTGYDAANRWEVRVLLATTSGETTMIERILNPLAGWTVAREPMNSSLSRGAGVIIRLTKVGNPGNLDIGFTLQYRQVK